MSPFGSRTQIPGLSVFLGINPEHPAAGGQDAMTRHDGGVVIPTTD